VRVFVMGANRWLDLDRWPPPAEPQPWFFQPHAVLATKAAPVSPPDRYRYDPAHPTPSLGGIVLGPHAGARDNRQLEARSDVLVYTSAPLIDDLEIVGPVHAELYVRSSLEHTDFFVRLCDVHPRGRSINICDGAVRLQPGRWQKDADGVAKVHVELWPTAHRFLKSHRVRLQVSSGAHPRIARNLGSGEPLASGSTMMAADQQVFHDPEHRSAVVLPVTGGRRRT
jgi:putative CocE/NonD family hydrolase